MNGNMSYICFSFLKSDIFLLLGVFMRDFKEIVKVLKHYLADSKEVKIMDKDVAKILGMNQSQFATIKKRNSIPYAHIIKFCKSKDLCCSEIFFH